VGEINAVTDAAALPTVMLRSISRLVPCKSSAFTEVDPVLGQSSGCILPSEPWPLEWVAPRFQAHIADHPVVQYAQRTRDGQARSISDFLTARQFHATGLYREMFGLMKIEDQLSIGMVGSAGLMIGLSFNRARRGFSQRDRDILNLLRPHVLQAYLTCRQLQILRNADGVRRGTIIDRLPIGLICVDRKGKVIWSTEPVRNILVAYYPDAADSIHGLPHAVRVWLRSAKTLESEAAIKPLISRRHGFRLQVRCCPLRDGHAVLLLQETGTREATPPLDQYGFTEREKQVMSRITSGSTAPIAAGQLGISPRTLGKHLERVFQKLGVNSLSAACIKLLGPSENV
jgi:DNA-binding CsgD family transcriptional regulator